MSSTADNLAETNGRYYEVNGVGSFSLADIAAETIRTFAESGGQSPIREVPADLLVALPGYYASTAGLSEIRAAGNRLRMYAFNQWFDVYFHEDRTLTLGYKILGIVPLRMPIFDELSVSLEDSAGIPAINLRLQGVLIGPAVKIAPVTIDPSWAERCGTYEAAGTEVAPQYTGFRLEVDRESGFLCVSARSDGEWSKFPLETVDSTSARLMGTGRGLGGTIRARPTESGEILTFLNFELRRVK